MKKKPNWSIKWIASQGSTVEEYDGLCAYVANGVRSMLGNERVRILSVESQPYWPTLFHRYDGKLHEWVFHQVPVVDGVIHDAWAPTLRLTPSEYASIAFPGQQPLLLPALIFGEKSKKSGAGDFSHRTPLDSGIGDY